MKSKKTRFLISLSCVLIFIFSTLIGGYILIDKLLVSKYFGAYGINNLKQLVNLVTTIYSIPNEKDFITNPYTKADSTSLTTKFTEAGFPTLSNGEIDYEAIGRGEYERHPEESFIENSLTLSDKEIASFMSQILESGVLISNFPDLTYIDTLKMEVKQVTITPKTKIEESSTDEISYYKKDASFYITIKIDTSSAKQQIAENIDAPKFLVDWIIPEVMYISASFDASLNYQWEIENTGLAINSKTAKQSEVLLSLLLSFIYPESENMTIDELSTQLASLVFAGLDIIGSFDFISYQTGQNQTNGIKLYLK